MWRLNVSNVVKLETCYAIFKTAVNGQEWACAIRDTKKEADEMADALNAGDKIGERFWVAVTRYTVDDSMPDVDAATPWYEMSEADEIILDGDEEITDDDYPDVPA
jgi:hypothetical protein